MGVAFNHIAKLAALWYGNDRSGGDGQGRHSVVRISRYSPTVRKVYIFDPAYDAFLEYARDHQDNPHVPRIYRVYEAGRAKLVVMEELQSVKDFLSYQTVSVLCELIGGYKSYVDLELTVDEIIDDLTGSLESDDPEHTETLIWELQDTVTPGLVKTVEDLREIADNFDFNMDNHDGNFMMRSDGTLVLVDPMNIYSHHCEYSTLAYDVEYLARKGYWAPAFC